MSWDFDDRENQFVFDEEPDIYDQYIYIGESQCPRCNCQEANLISVYDDYGGWKDVFVCINCGCEY